VWATLRRANEYIESEKPWALAKAQKYPLVGHVLRNLAACLRMTAIMLQPYMPETAEKIYKAFDFPQALGHWSLDSLLALGRNNYATLDGEFKLREFEGKYPPLFPRKEHS
jgi:methionyl-tRNA synthetase